MLSNGAATLLVNEMLSYVRVAASLVKRYSNVIQGCGCPSGKIIVDFM
jgi:hypothetical protein